jgi:hypothetical protein
VLSDSDVERNTAGIEANLRALLAPPPGSGLPHPVVVNNLDWLGPMPLLTFLRDVGEEQEAWGRGAWGALRAGLAGLGRLRGPMGGVSCRMARREGLAHVP